MCGGIVVQKVGDAVEVLDHNTFDRCWRKLDAPHEVREGDKLWWQGHKGYLTRKSRGQPPEFIDKEIGRCVACNPHGRESKVEV